MINVFKLAWYDDFQIWKIENITSIGFTIHAKDMMFQWCLVMKNWIAMSSSLIFVTCMYTYLCIWNNHNRLLMYFLLYEIHRKCYY